MTPLQQIAALEPGGQIKIGGYYGGHLSESDAEHLQKTGLYTATRIWGKVMEPNGHYYDNDYYIIRRKQQC